MCLLLSFSSFCVRVTSVYKEYLLGFLDFNENYVCREKFSLFCFVAKEGEILEVELIAMGNTFCISLSIYLAASVSLS